MLPFEKISKNVYHHIIIANLIVPCALLTSSYLEYFMYLVSCVLVQIDFLIGTRTMRIVESTTLNHRVQFSQTISKYKFNFAIQNAFIPSLGIQNPVMFQSSYLCFSCAFLTSYLPTYLFRILILSN